MLEHDYNKIFYYNEEINENVSIARCHICKRKIFRGYDYYKIEGFLFDQRDCASVYILSLASEEDYREFSLEDKLQFEAWYREKNRIQVYQLKI